MTSITTFPVINHGITESESLLSKLSLTASTLETVIQQPQYALQEAIRIEGKNNMKVVDAVERVTGFGGNMASMFEQLITELDRLPTQSEFNTACLNEVKKFWSRDNPEGIKWDETVESTIINRNLRTYIAQVNELHCLLLLKELFPQWKVVASEDLDILMGVDIVVETEHKRLYLHIFKNSQYSFLAFRKKERRGGRKNRKGKFIKLRRDFSKDKTLMYEGRQASSSDTTKFVNGIPLFKADWLKSQLLLFDNFDQFGEPLEELEKLKYLEDYLIRTGSRQEVA